MTMPDYSVRPATPVYKRHSEVRNGRNLSLRLWMDNAKQCDFLLMRYVPDPFKNEFVNIGVLLLGRESDFADVRFTRDWARVRCADPNADLDILEALESDIRQQLRTSSESREQIVYRLQDTLSNALQLSQ